MATGCQTPVRVKGQTTCIHHHGVDLSLLCETCNALACSKCLNSNHREHALIDLRDIMPERRRQFQIYVDETEKTEVNRIKEEMHAMDDEVKRNLEHFDKLIESVLNQEEILKQEMHLITLRFMELYENLKQQSVNILTTYKQNLKTRLENIEDHLKKCRTILQTASIHDVFDATDELKSQRDSLIKPSFIADFEPNKSPQGSLEEAFGKQIVTGYPEVPAPAKTQTVATKCETPTAKLLTEFDSPNYIDVLCPTADGNAWTSYCSSNNVILLNAKGEVQQKKEYNQKIRDLSVSPKTRNLWTCSYDTCDVMEWSCESSTEPVIRFKTKHEPYGLCVTGDDNILLGLAKQVIKMTPAGTLLLCTSTGTWPFRPVVRSPYKISTCHITGNIAVVDRDERNNGGLCRSKVIFLDKEFKEITRYDGIPKGHPHSDVSISGCHQFEPRSVSYGNTGVIVVADHFNCSLHLLSYCGQFKRVILTDTKLATTSAVGRDNILWAVFDGKRVKLFAG